MIKGKGQPNIARKLHSWSVASKNIKKINNLCFDWLIPIGKRTALCAPSAKISETIYFNHRVIISRLVPVVNLIEKACISLLIDYVKIYYYTMFLMFCFFPLERKLHRISNYFFYFPVPPKLATLRSSLWVALGIVKSDHWLNLCNACQKGSKISSLKTDMYIHYSVGLVHFWEIIRETLKLFM